MTNRHKALALLVAIAIAILCITGIFVGYKFLVHEKAQSDRIKTLENKVAFLQAGANSADSVIEWQDADYNYLAIGNSITRHGINEYWWNENGMAATKTENDFVHQIASTLQSKIQKNVRVYAHNFSVWELMSTDRTQTLQLLDGLLSDKLNLVTIQLSENATDLRHLRRTLRR